MTVTVAESLSVPSLTVSWKTSWVLEATSGAKNSTLEWLAFKPVSSTVGPDSCVHVYPTGIPPALVLSVPSSLTCVPDGTVRSAPALAMGGVAASAGTTGVTRFASSTTASVAAVTQRRASDRSVRERRRRIRAANQERYAENSEMTP